MSPTTPTTAAPPRGDVTFTERLGHVRRDEYLAEGDVGWAPEATVATRKRAPPPEVPGDAFDRQRAVPDFDQGVVQSMRCLVLGAGGVGQNVAMLLARLGVAEIHLVDCDVYDASNLNRQLLGTPDAAAAGVRKVDAAREGLFLAGHVVPGATEVFAHHLDAVREWARVAALARRSDVVFNGIDVGAAFDHAVASLGKELGVPVCVGQSYGWSYTSEYYPAHPDAPGGWDLSSVNRLFALGPTPPCSGGDSAPPPPRSTVERLRALYGEGLGGEELADIASGLSDAAAVDDGEGVDAAAAAAARLADAFRAECVSRLGAGRVAGQRDLCFLPPGRDAKIPTRYVGSWVVPCVGCATAMVGQWMAAVTGTLPDAVVVGGGGGGGGGAPCPAPRNPPTYVNYDVANGCTQEETAGRQLAETAEQWSGGAAMAVEDAAGLLLPPRQRSEPSEEGRRAAERSSPLLKGLLEDALNGLFFASGRVCLTEYAETTGGGDKPYTLILGADGGGSGRDFVWKASSVRVAEAAAAAAAAAAPTAAAAAAASNVPVTPQMPCKPLEVVLCGAGGSGGGDEGEGEGEAFPAMLATPLVKVKVDGKFVSALPSGDVVAAAASGIRSALVWRRRGGEGGGGVVGYRLKGCGNGDDGGFTLLPVEDGTGRVTHRGCGFGSTAMAEVRMCAEMRRAGVEVGNFPVGVWVYDGPHPPAAPVSGGGGGGPLPPPPPPPLAFALKGDQKCCGLFRTVGDRRAGDHLVAGLTKLFPRMVPAACLSAALRPAILRSRGGGGGGGVEEGELTQTDILAACGLPVSSPAAGLEGALREAPPARGVCGSGSSGERFDLVWNLAVERLHCRLEACKRAAGGAVPSVLLHVLERVGWECGEAMRRMQTGGLSWGTFTDDLGTHCNAHANNMVVKPVTLLGNEPSATLLAALDFDMAFDRGSWVGGGGGGGGGFAAFDTFDDVVLFEQTNGMRQALAGSTFASTGVANDAAGSLPEGYPQDVLCAAVHDTLVAAFDAGLEGKPSPYRPEMAPAVHAVVLLALCLTSGVVA